MVFENNEVEVFEFNGEILFNPYHVGKCLDIDDVTVRRHMQKMNDKQVMKLTNSIVQDMNIRKLHNTGENFLTERGVYKLAFKSRKPEAERFQDWVTDEVLPAIRRTGGYIPTTQQMSEQEIMARAVQISMNTIKHQKEQLDRQAEQLEQQAPKVLFADSVASSSSSILVFDLAKLLKQNGVNMGGNRLFAWLREHGYLVKRKGSDYNMPTQKSMNLGLFEIKESTHTHADGHTTVNRTPKVTGKGQIYFVSKFLEKELTRHETNQK